MRHTIDERLVSVTPSERQLRIQQMGFYAFVHFTVNTFTDREWGDGTENPSVFVKGTGATGFVRIRQL